MSDDDLLRRAAEVQNHKNGHRAALHDSPEHGNDNGAAAVERQLAVMESRLLQDGLPNGISRFRGAATTADQDPRRVLGMMGRAQAHASRLSNGSEKPTAVNQATLMQRQHSTSQPQSRRGFSSVSEAGQAGHHPQTNPTHQRQHSTSPQDVSKPLRYFNNGIEVDADGNPLTTKNDHTPAPASVPVNGEVSMQRQHSTIEPQSQSGISSRSKAGQPGHQPQTYPTQQRRHSTSPQDDSKPLRYFNNGIEVDADGNPLPTKDGHAPASVPVRTKNGTEVDADGRSMPTENGHAPAPSPTNAGDAPSPTLSNPASLDNNIIAKFLSVVVSRVPEIAPAVADLLPDGGDPAMLKGAFPNVVDATLAELGSVRERTSTGDARGLDLIRRATDCIAAIESYKAGVPSTQPVI